MFRALLVTLSLGFALAGCGIAPEAAQLATEGQDQPYLSQAPPSVAAQPMSIQIPSIGVDSTRSTWIPLGIQGRNGIKVTPPGKSGEIEVPPLEDALKLGWYCPDGLPNCGAPVPGQDGPLVVVGHINGNGKQGIFAKLSQVKVGAIVRIGRKDDRTATYHVTKISVVPKTEFPTDAVYGDTEKPTLRLITCGGGDNRLQRIPGAGNSYVNQTIVYAEQDSLSKTP